MTSTTTASTIALDYARAPNAALRPFGAMNGGAVTLWDHSGKSTYHSLQTQLISRFGRGSHFQASYTLSRSRANLAMTDSDGALSVGVYKLDVQDPDSDWGRPETGRDHIFNASLIWMLPALEDRSGIMQNGPGRLGDLDDRRRGHRAAAERLLHREPAGRRERDHRVQATGRTRPLTKFQTAPSEPCRASGGLDEQIINPDAFTLNGFNLGSIGSARRGDCTGPVSSRPTCRSTRTSAWEGTRFQFRWDIFNLFNNTNFLMVGLDNVLGAGNVVLNNANPALATAITSATPSGSFGKATRTP